MIFDPSEARRLAAMVRGWGPKERQEAAFQLEAAADLVEAIQAETVIMIKGNAADLTPEQLQKIKDFQGKQAWPILVDSDPEPK